MNMKMLIGSMSILVAAALFAGTPEPSDTRLKAIQGYRSWTKVNDKPVSMAPAVAALCIAPPPPKWREPSPHLTKFFTVYVNAAGRAAMMSDEPKPFPIGTVIVKEKLPAVGKDLLKQTPGTKVELLTVMVKREKGFDPGNGDWEYFAVSGDAKSVTSKDVKHCQDCHRSQKSTDYVYRDYPRSASRR